MTGLSCPADHELLPATTGERASAEVRAHLEVCPTCRLRLAHLQAEVSNLRRSAHAPLPSTAPGALRTAGTATSPGSGDKPLRADPSSAPFSDPHHPAPTLSAPQPATLGKYRVVAALNEGGQARVYRVVHPGLNKELVLKLGRRPLGVVPADQERLVIEGRLLAELDHPSLARIYDLDFHEGRPFLVMEYVRGRNLVQHAEQQRPSPRGAAALVAELARALAAAHARGISHQDLKPENILIDDAGRPRLIDFGMARLRHAWAEDADEPGTVRGTPEYMAPEQARGETDGGGPRSDLFALGAVLYFLLTGRAPFTGRDRDEVLDRAGRGDWDQAALRAARAPRRLEAVCRRALAAAPGARYARAEELAADLQRFLRRPRLLARLVTASAVLLLVLLGGWWWSQTRGTQGPPHPRYVEVVLGSDSDLGLGGALPLRPDDGLKVLCDLPRGLHASLFWFDTEGKLHQLDAAVSRLERRDQLTYPRDGVVRLIGPPGTEFILVCARRSQPMAAKEVADLFEQAAPLAALPAHVLVRLDRDRVAVTTERGPSQPEADDVCAVRDRLDRLRLQLSHRADFFAGVAFARRSE